MPSIITTIIAMFGPLISQLAKKLADRLMEWLNEILTRAATRITPTGDDQADADALFEEAMRLTRGDNRLTLRERVRRRNILRFMKWKSPAMLAKVRASKSDREEFAELAAGFK